MIEESVDFMRSEILNDVANAAPFRYPSLIRLLGQDKIWIYRDGTAVCLDDMSRTEQLRLRLWLHCISDDVHLHFCIVMHNTPLYQRLQGFTVNSSEFPIGMSYEP